MLEKLLCAVLGFVAGCSFCKFFNFGKKKSSQCDDERIATEEPKYRNRAYNVKNESNMNVAEGFSLLSIAHVFSEYHVEIVDASSFAILMRKIRYRSYEDILKKFIDEATSVDKLVKMLKEASIPSFDVTVEPANEAPYISESKLNEYIEKENVSPRDINSVENKVVFLLKLSFGRGLEDFKTTLSIYMTEFIENYEQGMDVSDLYQTIMGLIKKKYSLIKD